MGKSLPALRGVELLILGGCLLFGCSRGGVDRVEWPTMGTVAAVQYRGDLTGARPGCEAVRAVFDKVDSLLSAYDPSSELSRLAALGDAEVLAKCDPLVRPCYEAAFRLRDETEGLFNPRWKGPGTMDLGAIAKGFAVDLAVREAKISSDALIDLGGNLKAACGDWRVGVLSCEGVESGATAETLTLKPGEACATSAEYYRGKHIKDGRTGGDIDSKVKSVTVVHPTSAMLADGLSTVMFLLGRERGEAFLREHYPEARAIWEGAEQSVPDLTQYVLPEMGTAIDTKLSCGNLYPAVCRAWGGPIWSPQTNARPRKDWLSRWFYDYRDNQFFGFRCTHQPSPWIGDYGAWTVLPLTGKIPERAADRYSWYSHKAETLKPALCREYLADFDVTAELAPTMHGAAFRITWPETDSPRLLIAAVGGEGRAKLANGGRRVVGWSDLDMNHRGIAQDLRQHFVLEFDRAAQAVTNLADGALAITFAPVRRGERMQVAIATSLISDEQAALNLRECAGRPFDAVAEEGRLEWNELLSRIKVESVNLDRLRTFYTCLYRSLLFPRALWETDAAGKIVHYSPGTGKACSGYYYAGTGFWDTFRALFPLLNFLYPETNAKMMAGLQNCWRETGWLPEWSSPGLSNCMIGNNSASVVADAWLSGVRGDFDIHELYRALLHGANAVHPQWPAVGRCGFDLYNAKGYVPRDAGIRESAARTLEYAYDDWCIASLGRSLGRPAEEVALYEKRSRNWRNVFDPVRKIACGRNADGTFNPDFNRFAWGGDFTEGCALHYTWSVFHDIPGLVAAMGGAKAFESRLDEIFTLPPIAECSYYKGITHEAREMQAMKFGQYAHGNQPIQHMVYLYDWTPSPEKAGRRAREAMDRLYRPAPDGYCGDEDNGQTSAWFVWSAMGLYPVCPGSGEYATGCPLFDRIVLTLPQGGGTFQIKAPGAEARQFPKAPRPFVKQTDFVNGGDLTWMSQRGKVVK